MSEQGAVEEMRLPEVAAPEDLGAATEEIEPIPRFKEDKGPFGSIPREVTEEELDQPGVKRLVLHIMDQLRDQVKELTEFRELYHKEHWKSGILEEKTKRSNSHDIVGVSCFVLIGPMFGCAINVWGTSPGIAIILFLTAGLLLLSGIFAKAVKL
ncbi:MAG: hypothetical protein WBG50_08250 [Desulfomonilaceae bacterium]